MNTLILSGHGISMNVDGGKLHVREGHDQDNPRPQTHVYRPKYINLDNIIVYGHSGNISLSSIRWLIKQNVQLTFLNWDGRLLTNLLPIDVKHSNIKMAQYRAYDNGKRVDIARKFIDAKLKNSLAVLKWLGQRYPTVNEDMEKFRDGIESNHASLPKTKTVRDVMGVEGGFAQWYWQIVSKVFPERWEFESRLFGKTGRPMGAVDPINAILNYGYAILQSHCTRALQCNGLDPNVGFLHEINPSKVPLVYDLQEPFRWLVDVAIIRALECKVFNKKDFIRTENYNIRLRPIGVKKLANEIHLQFIQTVKYRNRNVKWENIVIKKGQELGQYLIGKRKSLDFSSPKVELHRDDNEEMRKRILGMSYKEWKDMGYSKGTLHQLKRKVKEDRNFTLNEHVKERISGMVNEEKGKK